MEANREESVRCLTMAQYAIRLEGDLEKAKRLTIKSYQMFPSKFAQDLLNYLMKVTQSSTTSSTTAQPPHSKEPTITTVSELLYHT